MARTKVKDWGMSSFSLKNETKTRIEELSKAKNMNKSELIDSLVSEASVNELERFKREIDQIETNITNKEFEISELKNLKRQKEEMVKKVIKWGEENSVRILEALEIVKRFLLVDKKDEAERYARSCKDLPIEWIELIYRAKKELEVSGI